MNTQTSFDKLPPELQAIVKRKKLTDAIGSVYLSEHAKPTWTPFELCEEMLDGVDLKGDVLVLSDLGFVPALKKLGADFSRVTVVVHTTAQEELATKFKVGKVWNIGYNDPIKELERELKGMKFDVVVGNPPYQDTSEKSHSNSLWVKFIGASVDHLAENGVLSLVVPATWAGGDLNRKVKGRQLTVTSLRSKVFSRGAFSFIALGDPVSSFFKVGVEFSAFVWHNNAKGLIARLKTNVGEIYVDTAELRWIPIVCSALHLSILNKVLWNDAPKITILQHNSENGDVRNPNIGQGPFELYNTSAQWKSGKHVFSTVDCPHRQKRKVIYSDSGYASPMFDDGNLGLCHHGRAVEVQSAAQAANMIEFLNSKLVSFLTRTKAASGLAVGFTLIASSLPQLDWNVQWTDDALAKHFSFTPAELQLIQQL